MGNPTPPAEGRSSVVNTLFVGFGGSLQKAISEGKLIGPPAFTLHPDTNGKVPMHYNFMKRHELSSQISMKNFNAETSHSSITSNDTVEIQEKSIKPSPSARELAIGGNVILEKTYGTSTSDVREKYKFLNEVREQEAGARNDSFNFEEIWNFADKQHLKTVENYLEPSIEFRLNALDKEQKSHTATIDLGFTSVNAVLSSREADENMDRYDINRYINDSLIYSNY